MFLLLPHEIYEPLKIWNFGKNRTNRLDVKMCNRNIILKNLFFCPVVSFCWNFVLKICNFSKNTKFRLDVKMCKRKQILKQLVFLARRPFLWPYFRIISVLHRSLLLIFHKIQGLIRIFWASQDYQSLQLEERKRMGQLLQVKHFTTSTVIPLPPRPLVAQLG